MVVPGRTKEVTARQFSFMDIWQIRDALAKNKRLEDLELRVVYYTRVSTSSDDQLHSLKAQVEYFDRFINERPNWTFVRGYVDEGITGTSTRKRDAFNQMMEDANSGKFDLIVTKEVSRFARNTLDSVFYTRELLKMSIGVLFSNDGFCTFEKDSELRLTIMSSIAQEESRKTSERVKWGHKRAIDNGVVLGNDRFWGYKKNNGKLELVPEEAEMVKQIFEWYGEGFGFRAIEKKLRETTWRNGNGNFIGYSTISGIIENPKYKGYYVGGKTSKMDFLNTKVKYHDKEHWTQWKDEEGDTVPAIITEELWEKCEKIKRERANKMSAESKTSYQNKYSYSGKIVCGVHGISYWHNKYKYKSGEKTIWQCGEYRRFGKDGCTSPHLYSHEIDYIMGEILQEFFTDKQRYIKKIYAIYEQLVNDIDYDRDIKELIGKIKVIEQKKDKLLELSLEGRLSNAEFEKRNNAFNDDLELLEEQMAKYEELNDAKKSSEETLRMTRKLLEKELNFEIDNKDELISKFLDRIEVFGTDVENMIKLRVVLKSGIEVPTFFKRNKDGSDPNNMRLSSTTHMIRADIETEIAPLVGTEKQSEELVNYLLREFEGEPEKLWQSNIFGKSLHELVSEGLQNKLFRMPEDAQVKLQETLQRIINEGSSGLICIIL